MRDKRARFIHVEISGKSFKKDKGEIMRKFDPRVAVAIAE